MAGLKTKAIKTPTLPWYSTPSVQSKQVIPGTVQAKQVIPGWSSSGQAKQVIPTASGIYTPTIGKTNMGITPNYNYGTAKPKTTASTGTSTGTSTETSTETDEGVGGGFEMPGYSGYQFDFNMPQVPGEYQLTEEDLAKFYAQATNEASQLFDPQVLSLQQTLSKNLLAASQTGGTAQSQYDAVIKSVDEWKTQAIKDEQARWYARGLGVGGGLVSAEVGLEKQATELKTTAGTEKAQKLSDIEAQKQLLTEQGGESEQAFVKQKASYITTRQQELADAYQSHKETIAQQTFQNQMAVQQMGMTAQAQAFDQWLQQTSLANDIWYQGSQMALAELENTQNEQYRKESLAAASKTGGVGGLTAYQQAQLDLQNKQDIQAQKNWQSTFAFNQQQVNKPKTAAELLKEAQDKFAWDAWNLANRKGINYGTATPITK